jgi:serine/threonine-protein kinase
MAGTFNSLGGYEIVREIARSNDIVYEARDPAMNRKIALKELSLAPNLAGEQRRERIERFYREARAAGSLAHPNIVTIFKVGEDNGRHFIAMEFLDGDTLRGLLQVGGPVSIQRAIEICTQVCDALEYAHRHGVVHRDIKPDNIQILPDGTVKITDFGIARLGAEPGITQAGQVFGTPSYMSPEQIAGKIVDARSDVFSLGVVLYEMLTSRKPFTGDGIVTITYNIMNMEPPPPPGVPAYLQQIIRRAMAKQPEQRFQCAADMARALASPAPAPSSQGATQHISSMPRVTSLPGAPTFPAPGPAFNSPPAFNPSPASAFLGSVGPAMGAPSMQPVLPGAGATGAIPPGVSPSPIAALPPRGRSFRSFMARHGPLMTLVAMTLVFVLIALGVFMAVIAGYHGYTNTMVSQNLFNENNKATQLLDANQFQQAWPLLQDLQSHVPTTSQLYSNVQHNTGVYWFEAGQAAQASGDTGAAVQDYRNARPLYPEKQNEIDQALTNLTTSQSSMNNSRPGSSISGTPAVPAQVAAMPMASGQPGSDVRSGPVSGPPSEPGDNSSPMRGVPAPGPLSGATAPAGQSSTPQPMPTPPAPISHPEDAEQQRMERQAEQEMRSGNKSGGCSDLAQAIVASPGTRLAGRLQNEFDQNCQ